MICVTSYYIHFTYWYTHWDMYIIWTSISSVDGVEIILFSVVKSNVTCLFYYPPLRESPPLPYPRSSKPFSLQKKGVRRGDLIPPPDKIHWIRGRISLTILSFLCTYFECKFLKKSFSPEKFPACTWFENEIIL